MSTIYIENPTKGGMSALTVEEMDAPSSELRRFAFEYDGKQHTADLPKELLIELDEEHALFRGRWGSYLKEGPALETSHEVSQQEPSIQVIEERVEVQKRWVDRGEVHVHQGVQTQQVQVNDRAQSEYMVTKTRPIGRVLEDGETPQTRVPEDGTMVIPVIEEKVVLVKQRILKEEFLVSKELKETPFNETVELRRTTVEVTRKELD